GPTDVVTRLVGDHMSRTLGQTLVIENIGGAGGTLGMIRAAQAQPDGYTIAVGNMGTQSAAPALYPNLKYDPAQSFAQVGIVNYTPQAIVAKKDTAAKTLKEFIDYLKANNTKAHLRPRRRWLDLPRVGPRLQREVRPHAEPRALSRHRASHPRPRGRRDRLHGRPIPQCHPADPGRHHQGLCHRGPRAALELAGRADDRGSRRRLHLQRLERHGRPQGHAEGYRRNARGRAQQGAL